MKVNRVCFFGTYFPDYSRNSTLLEGLKMLGKEVEEVNIQLPKKRLEVSSDFGSLSLARRVILNIKVSFKFLSHFNRIKNCDVILVLYPGHLVLPVAKLISVLSGKPLIFDSFTSLYDTLIIDRGVSDRKSIKTNLLKFIERLLLRFPDKLFVDTKMMKKFLIYNFGVEKSKIFIIPLGANKYLYRPKEDKNRRQIQVVTFGSYNPLQGAPYILEAIHKLQNEKNLRFILIGSGALKKRMIEYAREHLLINVKFINFVKEKDLVKYIQNANLMLGIFSKNDLAMRVIPNKVFAALACRKPLITARTPACEEFLLHKKNVYFCDPENSSSLTHAIKTLIHNSKLAKKIAENGYKTFNELFTPPILAQRLLYNLERV